MAYYYFAAIPGFFICYFYSSSHVFVWIAILNLYPMDIKILMALHFFIPYLQNPTHKWNQLTTVGLIKLSARFVEGQEILPLSKKGGTSSLKNLS